MAARQRGARGPPVRATPPRNQVLRVRASAGPWRAPKAAAAQQRAQCGGVGRRPIFRRRIPELPETLLRLCAATVDERRPPRRRAAQGRDMCSLGADRARGSVLPGRRSYGSRTRLE